jgi:hypothetical protein
VHSEERPAGDPAGPVVLDIGGDIGALVVHTGPERLGQEVEIEPAGRSERRTHVAVLKRIAAAEVSYAAVYSGLRAGVYTLLLERPRDHISIRVIGGEVVELDCGSH